MVKKKQPDFQKTKLKPGKILPRGRNVTNTSFKSKKIVMHGKTHKVKNDLTIKECLKNACRHTNLSISRKESLNQLSNLILDQKDTFHVYLNEIITNMKNFLFENDEALNNAAVKVIHTVLTLTDDLKISSYFPYLMNLLSCTMTHSDHKIKGMSLRLLDIFLKTHPRLTCYSLAFLKNLQSLMSVQSYNTKSKRSQNSNLLVSSGNTFYSQNWRFQVLAHMNMFLKEMLKNFIEDTEEEDDFEKEVHWNCDEGILYLELYAGGGLKPVDIEKFDPSKLKSEEYDLDDPLKVQEFMNSILAVLIQIFIEEISAGISNTDDELITIESINNLNILFQVLCHLGEWVKYLSTSDCDLEVSFTQNLVTIYRSIRKFPFTPRENVFNDKSALQQKFLPCVQLNLAVCYLYCEFVRKAGTGQDNYNLAVLNYIHNIFFLPYEIRYDSIPVLLKIVKIYMPLDKTVKGPVDIPMLIKDKELNDMLLEMVKLVKDTDDRPHQKLLVSFFVGLSLEVSRDYLNYESKLYMKAWFKVLWRLLQRMALSNSINKKLLKDIRVIAVRKHPYFMETLDKMKVHIIKGLLIHENDDLKETVIFLIHNMTKVSWELLQELNDVIHGEHNFPQKKAIALIRLLTRKFTEPGVSAEERVNFIAFLLNVAIDTLNLDSDKWMDDTLPEFKKVWEPCTKDALYTIVPSIHWKKHCKLYEVCRHSLNQFDPLTVNEVAKNLYIEIMRDDRLQLPVHSAIAMLKLHNPEMEGRKHYCLMLDLTYSCLFFVSVFTLLTVSDDWYEENVSQILNCLTLGRTSAIELIKHLEYEAIIPKEGIVLYYVLRIVRFLTSLQLIRVEDGPRMLHLFKNLEKNCVDRSISRQPLFIKLLNTFGNPYQEKCIPRF